jgi:hypothetical protein
MIEVKMAAEAQRSNWSPGEMGLGVGEKYPPQCGCQRIRSRQELFLENNGLRE